MQLVPDAMPVLSAGKHRSPRSGGCFMEIGSFLAGERWSDHPRCTDPALAELARCVNDVMPDSERSRLAPMIPSVIGTGERTAEERIELAAGIVRSCALVALPVVTPLSARPLACALITAECLLGETTPVATAALATKPAAHAFAVTFLVDHPPEWRNTRAYLTRSAPHALRCAVRAVLEDLGPGAPAVLTGMLAAAVTTARAVCGLEPDTPSVPDQRWREACALVSRSR
ncbi:MAG: hypothetical protein WCD35_04480 [Mycobacteriales bacterium]